ncbi:MAG: hypothetical protein PW788_13240 [Micavibrio sp.]|nr:hypothetical protein [Micavibrio sp.]
MKKIRSLVATFTLAAAAGLMGATAANAQTVPVQPNAYSQPVSNAYVSQDAIAEVAYNQGVQAAYYRAGKGYTTGTASSGETIGLEFQLSGGQGTVIRAFNLNDPASNNAFSIAQDNAAGLERDIANSEIRTRVYAQRYESYVVVPPINPILGIGWFLRPPVFGWSNPRYEGRPHYFPNQWDNNRPRNLYREPVRNDYRRPDFRDDHRPDYRNDNRGQQHNERGGERGGHNFPGPNRHR